MSNHFEVDTSTVRATGDQFQVACLEAADMIKESLARLNQFNGVWGKDETGHHFELAYQPPRDGLVEGLEAIPKILQNYFGGLGSTAAVYDRADSQADDLASGLAHRTSGRH